jgi:hypothetical protein
MRTLGWRLALGLVSALIAIAGCATIRWHQAVETEQALAAAGFVMKLGDTPDKLADLRSQPPRRLVPQERDGGVYYTYADPDACRCLYVGTEAQYQDYQRYAIAKRIADEELMAAQDDLTASVNWGLWAPWPWF